MTTSNACCQAMNLFLQDQRIPILYHPRNKEYGINLLDSRIAVQLINHCLWCGTELPYSLRDERLKILKEDYGINDPFDDEQKKRIPKEFKNDQWWKKRQYPNGSPIVPRAEARAKIKKRNLLHEIYNDVITEQESKKIYEKYDNLAWKIGLHSFMKDFLGISEAEQLAYANENPLTTIAQWRYEGWPKQYTTRNNQPKKENKHCCSNMSFFLEEQKVAIKYYPISRGYFIDAQLPLLTQHGLLLDLKKYEYARQSIYFCPWCGTKLPAALNNTYFKVLEKEYGIHDLFDEEKVAQMPKEFKSDEWWKKREL